MFWMRVLSHACLWLIFPPTLLQWLWSLFSLGDLILHCFLLITSMTMGHGGLDPSKTDVSA